MSELSAIGTERLGAALASRGTSAGLRITTELEPIDGPLAPVKPVIYNERQYQTDRRWQSKDDEYASDVIVVDGIPSQANRIENAVAEHATDLGVPELVLELTDGCYAHLPSHLPRRLSSWRWPHRHADAYLVDSLIDGKTAYTHPLGNALLGATSLTSGALLSWFPQSLLFGFWQSHQGKKRTQTKHARAWRSEIVGWDPATLRDGETGELRPSETLGTKGDPYNVSRDVKIKQRNLNDRHEGWDVVPGSPGKKKEEKPSSLGHGQVPFDKDKLTPMGVSFRSITQTTVVSFAHLRRVRLGPEYTPDTDAAARVLLVALGLYGYRLAFGQAFHLRSGADLRPVSTRVVWLGSSQDEEVSLGDVSHLFAEAKCAALEASVPLMGWDSPPLIIVPGKSLENLILQTWPKLGDQNSTGV